MFRWCVVLLAASTRVHFAYGDNYYDNGIYNVGYDGPRSYGTQYGYGAYYYGGHGYTGGYNKHAGSFGGYHGADDRAHETKVLKMEVQRLDRQNHQMNEEIKELKKDNQQFKYYIDLIKATLKSSFAKIQGVQVIQTETKAKIDEITGTQTETQNKLNEIKMSTSVLCGYQRKVTTTKGLSTNKATIIYTNKFDEINGIGSDLDIETGVFTAGERGVYQISVSARNGRTIKKWLVIPSAILQVKLKTSLNSIENEEILAQQKTLLPSTVVPFNAIRYMPLEKDETAELQFECIGRSLDCRIEGLTWCISFYAPLPHT